MEQWNHRDFATEFIRVGFHPICDWIFKCKPQSQSLNYIWQQFKIIFPLCVQSNLILTEVNEHFESVAVGLGFHLD